MKKQVKGSGIEQKVEEEDSGKKGDEVGAGGRGRKRKMSRCRRRR